MSNQVQTTSPEKKRDIRTLIQSDAVKQQMAMVLPKHITADRMARVACTAILKTPKLAQCKPESLLQALMLCSQAGLEPDGRNAHLIPYGDIVQVIFDWKGIVARARENGVKNIAADIVCENDLFEFSRTGDGLQFNHKIDFRKPRGAMFAAFCIWKDGEQFDGEVMTKDEVDGIRKRSKAGSSGPWVTDYNEMAKKTVIRRASKKWPLDADFAEAINADSDALPPLGGPAKPVFAGDVVALSESGKDELMPPAETTPTEDEIPGAESPKAKEEKPAAEKKSEKPKEQKAPPVEETPVQYVKRVIGADAQVPFDDFRDAVKTLIGGVPDIDSWASYDEVSPLVAAKIIADVRVQVKIIKTYGKK